jgi:LPPG:FO 2-phospho-L-lactate transferase
VYTVLAGGVGASRFLQGLVQVVDPAEVTVISNTGDDVEMFGLYVSPDVDIVIYALAGAVNPATGWGLTGDTFSVVDQLQRFGYPRWFNLGDRDLAMAVHRTRLLREGTPLHEVVAGLRRDWGLGCTILPMSNDRIETRIIGPDGEIAFQDYMVRLRTEIEVRDIVFSGIESAAPAPGVLEALANSGGAGRTGRDSGFEGDEGWGEPDHRGRGGERPRGEDDDVARTRGLGARGGEDIPRTRRRDGDRRT